jgi:hypothetical protein
VTYTTKELSPETWPDFDRLFAPGTGWAFCACMFFQRGRHLPQAEFPRREAMRVKNRAEKRVLVDQGRAHGILVYENGEPVGWCQYGPPEELPIPGSGRTSRRIPPAGAEVRWRITCFVTRVRGRRGAWRAQRCAPPSLRSASTVAGSWRLTRRCRSEAPTTTMAARSRCSSARALPSSPVLTLPMS